MSPSRAQVIRHLHELIAALDRRVPHVERAGEASIARDAADLRSRAVKRRKVSVLGNDTRRGVTMSGHKNGSVLTLDSAGGIR